MLAVVSVVLAMIVSVIPVFSEVGACHALVLFQVHRQSLLLRNLYSHAESQHLLDLGRLGQTFLLFFGCGTSPKRSGSVLACFWTDVQPEPPILDPIRAVFEDLGPGRHFGRNLARPGTGREALGPAHTSFFLTK